LPVRGPTTASASRERFPLKLFDAQDMPFEDHSKDVVILFEALYYLPSAAAFVAECRRVLRPGGRVLIATVNKDLWEFHPSDFSVAYYGVPELRALFEAQGFATEFFGFEPVDRLSPVQSALRVVKRLAVASGLMPRTMAGKRWLKRIFYGPQVPMPGELEAGDGQIPATGRYRSPPRWPVRRRTPSTASFIALQRCKPDHWHSRPQATTQC
jgi:SAM-dependent methyltransferase